MLFYILQKKQSRLHSKVCNVLEETVTSTVSVDINLQMLITRHLITFSQITPWVASSGIQGCTQWVLEHKKSGECLLDVNSMKSLNRRTSLTRPSIFTVPTGNSTALCFQTRTIITTQYFLFLEMEFAVMVPHTACNGESRGL